VLLFLISLFFLFGWTVPFCSDTIRIKIDTAAKAHAAEAMLRISGD
jgi:hypothetical protein